MLKGHRFSGGTFAVLALVLASAIAANAQDREHFGHAPSRGLTHSVDVSAVPTGDWWLNHFTTEILPFWTMPSALGTPLGSFPSTRCNDGSLIDYNNPCPEVNSDYLMAPEQYLVALSRQTYGYGVAFHLTGDPKYLDYMKAGVNYIRQNAIDHYNGGMYTQRDVPTNTWGPAAQYRNPQELGYGLLGLAMYYYLTRDQEVLPDILAVKQYIYDAYYNDSYGALQWMLASTPDQSATDMHIVATLDQLNTYTVLTSPILPEPERSAWLSTAVYAAHMLMDRYYSPQDNLMFLMANSPQDVSSAAADTDFGHTIKAMWMIRNIGLIAGKQDLVDFAEQNGRRVLQRAYMPGCGCWAEGVKKGAIIDANKSWWIYAELDQFTGSLGMTDPSVAAAYLPQTVPWWQRYFVDHTHGETWSDLDATTNLPPAGDSPKAWPWKNAYHTFEHCLVGYISAQQMHGKPVTLYYAFNSPAGVNVIRPYFYSGTVDHVDFPRTSATWPVWKVVFTDVR